MAQYTAPQKQGLGPGFWQVTIGLTVLNVIVSFFIAAFDIDKYLPEAAAPAGDIDWLFKFLSVVGNAIFVYVVGYIVYFAVVWRRRPSDGPEAIGIQIHDNPKLELWWTIVPTILMLIIAIFSVRIWMSLQNSLGDVLTMESIGHQFKYEFRYPRLKQSVYDDMHIPVGTPITLHVTAADVLHSFWVPEVRIKADMVPGLVQTLRFTPERIGTYRIICTEFCGTQHGNMVATLHIDSQQDFGRWPRGPVQGAGSGRRSDRARRAASRPPVSNCSGRSVRPAIRSAISRRRSSVRASGICSTIPRTRRNSLRARSRTPKTSRTCSSTGIRARTIRSGRAGAGDSA